MAKAKYYVRGTLAAQPEHDTRQTEWVPVYSHKQVPWIANAIIDISGVAKYFRERITEDTFKGIWSPGLKHPYMSLTDSVRYCTIEVVAATAMGEIPEQYARV